jgi:hypothetical protein
MARETCPAMLMMTSSPAPDSESSVTSVCRLSCHRRCGSSLRFYAFASRAHVGGNTTFNFVNLTSNAHAADLPGFPALSIDYSP